MAGILRVSGTKTTSPKGPINVNAPDGNINLVSTTTNVSQDLVVEGIATVKEKLVVSNPTVSDKIFIREDQLDNVNNPFGYIYNPSDIYGTTAQRKEGALYVPGGVGIEKDLNVGGYIYGRISLATTSQQLIVTATNVDSTFYPVFTDSLGVGTYLYGDQVGDLGGLVYNPGQGKLTVDKVKIASAETSTDPTTGALQVKGGAGIEGEVNLGNNLNVTGEIASSNIYPNADNQYQIGEENGRWAEAYLEKIYSKFIGSTGSNLTLAPGTGVTEVEGDIRVLGQRPIGTAPVVTNILYVTMDGNDTNDGRAMDASRACRTVGGAINSPYYQPGTQIRVAPGHYLEDNPLQLKPYTSVMGSDIRTTSIEPINKTQDLFHLNSGCYLAFMQFLNGRSGLLEGPYEDRFNRGAYCTAFPPLEGDERIDLFHSPYVQNCTNLSGPWLKDGTMFVPNQTVQIPLAIGTGTWNRSTTTIVVSFENEPYRGYINAGEVGSYKTEFTGTLSGLVNVVGTVPTYTDLSATAPSLYDAYTALDTNEIWVYTGAKNIQQGMTVNAGQQNPGFFNARTLLLASKPFMQEQVIAFVDQTFNTGTFIYDQVKCQRDVGLIVDSIALDMLQDSTSESIFAGLQYWRQTDYVDAIGNQITTTTNAITFLATLAANTATAAGGATPAGIVTNRFTDIITILNTSTATLVTGDFSQWVTDSIVANGLPTTTATYVAAYDALIAAKENLKDQTIAYISGTGFTNFNTATCRRDIGYIIDSVAFDLLHGGNKQSIKSGVYYFGYNGDTTEIPNEVPQTTAAYNFIKSIIPNIVLAQPIVNPYQGIIAQTTGTAFATTYEAEALQDKIDVITNIIRNGPDEVAARIPINLATNTSTGVTNAWGLIQANRSFIQAETIAYLNATMGTFNYSREKCFRDVGILVENVAYDAAFGGNQKSVESGLAYYDGVVSRIAGQESQTIAAIDYLNQLCQKVITNTTCTDLLSGTGLYKQEINIALPGGNVASRSIDDSFSIITDIISNGPDAAPAMYMSPGPDAAFVSAEILMQANRAFIQQDTVNYINNQIFYSTTASWVTGSAPYSEVKCRRDLNLILDSILLDLQFPTEGRSQSTFAGLQYWNQDAYVGNIAVQLNPTVDAIKYLKDTSVKIIQNITPADDLVSRYQTSSTQITTLESATVDEVISIRRNFDVIIDIVSGNKTGWTDKIIPNGFTASNFLSVQNAVALLQANKDYLGYEVTAYVDALNPGLVYDQAKCRRDIAYMIDAVCFDLTYGGNRQSVQNGLYYYGFSSTSSIHSQNTQTVAAFNDLATILGFVIQNQYIPTSRQTKYKQDLSLPPSTGTVGVSLATALSTITNIIGGGPSVAYPPTAIAFTATTSSYVFNAIDIINKNRNFLIEETIAFIDQIYHAASFQYDEAKCYRDVGLIVDAVSQDILLGGNYKSIDAGLAYWSAGYNSIAGQETTTTMAINHARDIALQVIANTAVTPQTGTTISQIINPYFQYGGDYMPQEAVKRNFNIITTIIQNGPEYAPPRYMGGGVFPLTGINGADVLIAPKVTSVSTITTGTYLIGLSTATIGSGTNATLYFGDTLVFPYQNSEVEEIALNYTGDADSFNQRKVDPIGGMGGSLVDGAVISARSPIQSFVYDAFTQLTQGGRGVRITNNGYAQLVSVFTIFASTGVQVDNGGIASIVNSNANFGDVCLLAKGFGKRKFSGTIYNPPFKAFDATTGALRPALDIYYPFGFWPGNASVEVFLPDVDDRPHISLVMEVEPPEGHQNEQELPGFLNAIPNKAILNTGTITIEDVDTDGIVIGNELFIRDQFGSFTATNGVRYCATGTIVTDLGYRTVTLSKALTSGGGQDGNDNFFNLYFCGNAYYTVLNSVVAENPKTNGINLLSAAATGGANQVPAHIAAIRHLNTITNQIINNATVTPVLNTASTVQTTLPLVNNGGLAQTFIDLRFQEMINIINAANVSAAEAVIPKNLRTKTGPAVQGAGSAITLIEANIEFLADEVSEYVKINNPGLVFNEAKCQRDVKIILQRLIYDIESGGRYNSVMTGLSYWSRNGTHHVVRLGENVRRTDLFPDGSTVNFYQRSYISASGYVFEYVGAGTNYGALPQVGRADPVQGKETVQLGSGKVFFTSTDQNGDFRIGPGLVISQATGVLSGRTFTKSLFANMTPFILAIESGGG